MGETFLSVDNLSLTFSGKAGIHHALIDVSFHVDRGEILSFVGESGCGKSVTAMSVMRLLPRHGVHYPSGSIVLDGEDLLQKSEREMRAIRGGRIGMIFQDPMTSFTPVHTIGMQIAETVARHRGVPKKAAMVRALEMLDLVRIPDAKNRINAYPHELSGGMRQRVMIAMALACDPELLIADEPTTALDVTVQAEILELITDLRRDLSMSVILITHDLGVVAETADRVMVMYAGRVVEEGPVASVLGGPAHGYTAGLIEALPLSGALHHRRPLKEIPGAVPRLDHRVEHCIYADRCAFATPACKTVLPEHRAVGKGHRAACLNAGDVAAALETNEIVRAWQ
ncbi:ABC transporter ATP-binding protein [Martelella sp. AD-3]|uniref:ABC transporter ATP-binding protein n=1 Tax=Martelella sp. AD-3 TaxID=686597 RepID=UPI000463DB25|nr:ABC transporter ATP-binding protein [Martelella sp. AD-3]AMM85178.1 peptide ABC transporter ATP-binding protein [Martelella sp. AD-3]